jgi:hypothetical protein
MLALEPRSHEDDRGVAEVERDAQLLRRSEGVGDAGEVVEAGHWIQCSARPTGSPQSSEPAIAYRADENAVFALAS